MARSPWRWAATGLVLASLVAFPGDRVGAQQDPAPAPDAAQQPPVFRTGITFVRVDVLVSDSKTGQPVLDLKPTDFQVTENNTPQKVETFKLVKLDGGVTPSPDGPPRAIRSDIDEELEASRDDVRLFAIFLDDYHVRRGASVSVRDPIARFIQTQLGPSDMLGLMYPLQAVSAVRMTRDHDRVVQGLGSFVGRKYDYTPRNAMEAQYTNYSAEEVEQIRNQVSLSALKGLIIHMGSLKEGRKALILVSEGYSNSLPAQLRDPVAALPGFENPDRENPDAGRNDPNEDRRQFFADSTMQFSLQDVYDLANKNNVAIYAVDPRGLPVSEFDLSQPTINSQVDREYLNATLDTLRLLAEQTDGRAIVNRNDLGTAMTQIVRDTSTYYLLGYNSTLAPSDGKFHEIKVKVTRPGVQVRARKGYWAMTTADVARALAPPRPVTPRGVETALSSISVPSSAQNIVRTWIGASRGADGKTKMTFVWEPSSKVRDAGSEGPTNVTLTAVGPDGAPYFRGRVPDSRITFDANPGKLQLRLSVEGTASQVLDSESREVVVPDLTAADAILGTPQIMRARTAREFQQLKADSAALPAAAREFSRTERLLIRVPAYGPGDTAPVLSAHLLNRGGQPMSELPVASSASPELQQIELGLAGLAPGEDLVQITAATPASWSASVSLHSLLAAGLAAAVAVSPQSAEPPEKTAPVHTVRIDAIAVDARGTAISTLTPRDFELREDGKLLPVDEAQFVKQRARLVAVFVDEYHITPGEGVDRARAALSELVDRALGPDDLLVVMKPLDSLFAIRLTTDREQARRIIAGIEGRDGDFTPRTDYERTYMVGPPERIEAARMQVAVSALNALAVQVGSLNDLRKTLLVVSERLDAPPRRRGQEHLATIDGIVRSANRSNVSIYPIDPRRPSASGNASNEILRSIARDTGGSVVGPAGGGGVAVVSGELRGQGRDEELGVAIRRILSDADVYYMLTYRNPHVEDGAFHPVDLQVKRAKVQVRARAEWAPSAEERELLALANKPPVILPLEPPGRRSPLIHPWFGLSMGDAGKMRVTFVWEPSAVVPGDRVSATAARLELTVLGDGDAVVFAGPVRPTGPGVVATGNEPSRAIFDTAPGRLRLRMKIQDAAERPVDSDVRELLVRDLHGKVAIGTPEFLRARNAREFRALGSDRDAVPVSSREFSRSERLLIRFPAYSPDGQPPTVSARLLNRMGQPMRPLVVHAAADGDLEVDLLLSGLASGDYLVELAARSAAGQATERLDFRVTN